MTSKLPDADDVLHRDHPLRRLPGSVVSRVSGGFERMKEDISALFRGPVFPRPRPDPRPPQALLLSPAALSVLDGPSISRSEIERFKLELQNALAEVNQSVEVAAKGRLSAYDRREEVVHIINLLEVHAADVKYAIDVGVSSGKVSKEGAQELKSLIDHLVLSMRNVHQWKLNFSTSNLTALLGLPLRLGSLAKQVTSFVSFVQTVLLLRGNHVLSKVLLRSVVDPILSYLSPDMITTQVGAMLDYCFASNRMRCMIGVNHEFDSDTTLKARIDTSGGATAMVKSKIAEKAFVSVSTEVNLNDVWRLPRVGVCLSLNQ